MLKDIVGINVHGYCSIGLRSVKSVKWELNDGRHL